MQKFDPGYCVEELTRWTAATLLIRREVSRWPTAFSSSQRLSLSLDRRRVAPSVSNRGGRPIPRRTAGNATAGTERQDLQRLWKNPTDISKWSFLIRQRICREGQASFSRPHSRLATLSLTVKSDPQRPERARPATSRVARTESRSVVPHFKKK